ncbi:MAG: hypothetical protein HQ445_09080 [Polaromonas sp.]|nr:hypothetical protein [Polaromonas sp.]
MRLYKISTAASNFDDSNAHLPSTVFVGSQSEAASARKLLIERGATRKNIESVEVDVPTDKAGLLGYLNGLVA